MAAVKGPIGAVWSPTEILEKLPLDFTDLRSHAERPVSEETQTRETGGGTRGQIQRIAGV